MSLLSKHYISIDNPLRNHSNRSCARSSSILSREYSQMISRSSSPPTHSLSPLSYQEHVSALVFAIRARNPGWSLSVCDLKELVLDEKAQVWAIHAALHLLAGGTRIYREEQIGYRKNEVLPALKAIAEQNIITNHQGKELLEVFSSFHNHYLINWTPFTGSYCRSRGRGPVKSSYRWYLENPLPLTFSPRSQYDGSFFSFLVDTNWNTIAATSCYGSQYLSESRFKSAFVDFILYKINLDYSPPVPQLSVALPTRLSSPFLKFICFPFRIQLAFNWIKYQEQGWWLILDRISETDLTLNITSVKTGFFDGLPWKVGQCIQSGDFSWLPFADHMYENGSKCRLV